MQKMIDTFIQLNTSGRILELCETCYADDVLMLNNGAVFAKTRNEAYEKQKGFVNAVAKFDIKLLSQTLEGERSELIFHYRMTTHSSEVMDFKGKHVQYWKNGKIIKEEYSPVNAA